ncbi:hypothetical protein ALP50_103524 [Pseudomonas syringae pv. spinaceae]|uniref:Uncharacterized protein n=1 Tax=Pseudomonas syringae pv. spinaceae TaxID=264459 RepID=A0A0Q0AT22_PSESX|nr:hypothetical protein ALO94_101165 [Pseudomonas syringae pv. spinaceae]RMT27552.1 hypothetical protein ALP50_103524 [Pseudomonas syringae pv. spinaceae]
MLQSIHSVLQALAGVPRLERAAAVRIASVSTRPQLNTYYGYWFSHWRV